MITTIPSNKERFRIKLTIASKIPFELGIRVYNPLYSNSFYFRRKALFKKSGLTREFTISMPVSPEVLEMEIFDKNSVSDAAFVIENVKLEKMPAIELWATDTQHKFLEFAIGFAEKAGYVSPGFFESKDGEFLFQYLPSITDRFGNDLITPARIHRKMPRVQISQSLFKGYTVPIRVAILAHEGCHWFLNTRSQTTADLCGIKQYLDYGFPKIEAVYAVTKVFGKNREMIGKSQISRTKDVIRFIENYTEKEHERSGI
ncbi:hypothetical protein [Kordia jejudonensis]|uniref:hypothetical protein n=1 Tax=Kordia jejudonensis TaxID=1348245 RepID=UPI000629A6F8|nr:hypothetical protein [Kordia jejudonensis]